MATSDPQPASPSITGCGSVTFSEGDRRVLASKAAIEGIDAQPSTSPTYAHEMSDIQGPVSPHSPPRSALADTANLGTASAELNIEFASSPDDDRMPTPRCGASISQSVTVDGSVIPLRWGWNALGLEGLPNEILMQILGFLDVSDLLTTSRINHHFRTLSLAPILHRYRLQRVRIILPPMLASPSRPTLAELIARHIFLTHTTQISRRLARNLVSIRLSRRLPERPSAETLVQRGVLPPECVPGCGCAPIAPALVAKRRAVEKEKLKDGLRRWVGAVWRGEVNERSEGVKKWEERAGVGRVWRLRRFWERVGQEAA
ncbi:hypothetical protein F4808DRAFT_464891 [Astrocystis sublimbata]|nr:hypothetical protein F4808DRAFT_464891 [Astrocystis sublimbata]